jgi:hypothetical protein
VTSHTAPSGAGSPRDPLRARDPRAIPSATWRSEIRGASGANVLAGLWLVISPLLLGYAPDDPVAHDMAIGAAIALLAAVRIAVAIWRPVLSWINAALGLWLLAATLWLAESATAAWNEGLVGAVVVVLAALSAAATDAAP